MVHIDPPRSEWDRLRPALTRGERLVGTRLAEGLSDGWEVYVQPHMNGLRPDFVLLHPRRGVVILEVKDWKDEGSPALYLGSALEKVKLYLDEARDLYVPEMDRAHGFPVAAHLVVPLMERSELLHVLKERRLRSDIAILSREHVQGLSAWLEGALPEGDYSDAGYRGLRHWLVEPEFNADQRQPLEVDADQRNLIRSRTKSGMRRIRGAAGSGKSLVLAGRAAELARRNADLAREAGESREVLVVSYNITLVNYLRDLAVRWPDPSLKSAPIRDHVTWIHFHGWCKRVCRLSGAAGEYRALPWKGEKEAVLEEGLAKLTGEVLDRDTEFTEYYDAILVDEGQDFRPEWWSALRKAVRPEGEMLLVADSTQDLYQHARAWTDAAMEGAGFKGSWVQLNRSYRLPGRLVEVARQLAVDFVRSSSEMAVVPESPQGELDLYPVTLRWYQVAPGEDAARRCFHALLEQLEIRERLGVAELVFLASSRKLGEAVVALLQDRNIRVQHTFDDREGQKMKHHFFKGDARVKATTLHSFKGWESRAVVLHVGRGSSPEAVYAGLTRLKRSEAGSILTVVCEGDRYREFGARWFEEGSGDLRG